MALLSTKLVGVAATLAVILIDGTLAAEGSCNAMHLCCPGRDSSCVVQKSAVNTIAEGLNDKPCYCDGACIALGDCCADYKESCSVIDCELSEWGDWSACDAECGLGTMSRTRTVKRQPQNGGRECLELHQKRGCHGFKCEVKSHDKTSKETALILPSRFSNTRNIDETADIRKNLRLRYPKDPQKENSHKYCVVFEVVKSRKACDTMSPEIANKLQPGSRVCVQCEDAAMRKHLEYRCQGHGVEGKMTRWTSLAVHNCHGRWIRREQHRECPCHPSGHPDFIFV